MELNECKIKDFDDIYNATKESQGYENAILAIRYVLFDDESVLEGNKEENKYLYISNGNNARKKAMLMQTDDLAHILIKYCMASFGLREKNFTVTSDDIIINQKRIDHLEISAYEMIEQVSYLATNEPYNAYEYLFANKKILNEVVEYMIEERYIRGLQESLDNFTGIINNNDIGSDIRYTFYDAYNKIDESFAEIKRNNPNYIK